MGRLDAASYPEPIWETRLSDAATACCQPILWLRADASNLPGPYSYPYQKAILLRNWAMYFGTPPAYAHSTYSFLYRRPDEVPTFDGFAERSLDERCHAGAEFH